jgi:hypothetical protein
VTNKQIYSIILTTKVTIKKSNPSDGELPLSVYIKWLVSVTILVDVLYFSFHEFTIHESVIIQRTEYNRSMAMVLVKIRPSNSVHSQAHITISFMV